jgi:hypothetical protein
MTDSTLIKTELNPIVSAPVPATAPDQAAVAVWQGFTFAWRNHNHRLAQLASILDSFQIAGVPPGHLRFRNVAEMKEGPLGGDDIGDAITFVTRITARDVNVVHGAATMNVNGIVDTGPVVKSGPAVSLTLPFSAGPTPVATVVLRGFRVACLSDPGAIPTRGFGLELTNIAVSGNKLTFTPRYTVHPDGSPSFPFMDGEDFTYKMTAFYTVLAAPAGKAAFHHDGPSVAQYAGPRLAPVERQESAVGPGNGQFDQAVVGVRGVRWLLQNHAGTAEDGRHVRRLHAYVTNGSYVPATGAMSFVTHQWFDNSDIGEAGFNAVHELLPTLIQFNGGLQPAQAVLHSVIDAGGTGQALQTIDL